MADSWSSADDEWCTPEGAPSMEEDSPVHRAARLEHFVVEGDGLDWAEVILRASAGGVHEGLVAVRRLARALPEWERARVEQARAEGWGWAEIARALGRHRQPVHRKYAHPERSTTRCDGGPQGTGSGPG